MDNILKITSSSDLDKNLEKLWKESEFNNKTNETWKPFIQSLDKSIISVNWDANLDYTTIITFITFNSEQDKLFFILKYA